MRKIASVMLLWAGALLVGCGGGGSSSDAFQTPATGTGGTTAAPNVASVTVTASQATILADGTQTATISAFVRDATNTLLKGVTVSFGADTGALEVRTAITGVDGVGTAILSTPGNATPRTITVTATAGTQKGTTTVQVITAPPPATVGSLTLTTSTPTIPSDSSLGATISATVRDTSNRFIANVPVTITASSGGITVPSGPTNASGTATATLTAADPTNRTITVTATAQGVSQTINVAVVGTRLAIQGPSALNLGQTGSYTLSLIDSSDHGIAGKPIVIASARGNTLAPVSPLTTGPAGTATFTMNVTNAQNDTITATTLGLTATAPVAVNSDSFTFTTPAANAEVNIGTTQSVTVHWLTSGAPVVGQTVTFATTRGTLSAPTAVTNASGDATVTVSSASAGQALITASGTGNATANQLIEFVATTPSSIVIQPDVFTLAPSEQATLTAVVRDAANNLVKNKTVTFSLQSDSTGGTLSLASAVTNSQGRAQTVYTAGSTTSAVNGVVIAAAVTGAPTSTVALTVATKAVFIALGTGNTISEDTTGAQYIVPYVVQVTDANGNGVPNLTVQMSVLSTYYLKGARKFDTVGSAGWTTYNPASPPTCIDEDTNRNGQLDPGEDTNNSGRLEAGNIALVTPNTVTTNAQGFANVSVLYPQEYAYWLIVALQARVAVSGTEFARTSTFLLPGLASDFNTASTSPPGPISPFGVNACGVAN